mmetsp:Transcript_39204/g.103330  ORF Transcript_39204/g.103330 Transcript_39204/m.103330 type:complete len:204 (+) Transcript_39204:1126-1737(+)
MHEAVTNYVHRVRVGALLAHMLAVCELFLHEYRDACLQLLLSQAVEGLDALEQRRLALDSRLGPLAQHSAKRRAVECVQRARSLTLDGRRAGLVVEKCELTEHAACHISVHRLVADLFQQHVVLSRAHHVEVVALVALRDDHLMLSHRQLLHGVDEVVALLARHPSKESRVGDALHDERARFVGLRVHALDVFLLVGAAARFG